MHWARVQCLTSVPWLCPKSAIITKVRRGERHGEPRVVPARSAEVPPDPLPPARHAMVFDLGRRFHWRQFASPGTSSGRYTPRPC